MCGWNSRNKKTLAFYIIKDIVVLILSTKSVHFSDDFLFKKGYKVQKSVPLQTVADVQLQIENSAALATINAN